MTQPNEILEIKHKLNGTKHEFMCQTLEKHEDAVVMLYRLKEPVSIEDQHFVAGTLSLGYFWEDRNYNVYHWVTPEGESQAVYVNIADRTTINADIVEWRDLILDLLITPDGRCQLLDEDELPDNLSPELEQLIWQQTRKLQAEPQVLREEIEARSAVFLAELLA